MMENFRFESQLENIDFWFRLKKNVIVEKRGFFALVPEIKSKLINDPLFHTKPISIQNKNELKNKIRSFSQKKPILENLLLWLATD